MSKEEVVRRGREIYEREIRGKVEGGPAKYVVVDVETGSYEAGDDYAELADRLHRARPGAPLFAVRVGHRALGRIGFRGLGGSA